MIDRIKDLEDLIRKNKALYYQGRPEIHDTEYDLLEDELRKLDPANPVLTMVGSVINKNMGKIAHEKKMLSLNKTYSVDDLKDWMKTYEVISMYKVDGVSCSLVYENNELVLGKTRGDGSFGEDVTLKVKWIPSVPGHLSKNRLEGKIEIRGELLCTEEDFFHLSNEMEKIGLDRPQSQRNIVAGLIGRKENLELSRYLKFRSFDIIENFNVIKSESEKHAILKKMGFETLDITLHKDQNNVDQILKDAEIFISEGFYQIDGLVFAYNDLKLQEELGETTHHPRYKMAFKFKGESKKTIIKEIIWSVSRNGILTPVGIVTPVEISGAKISRVTLHNYGLVKQHNLKIGDEIEIIRSGEVIPKFMEVVKSSGNEFIIPTKCPSCSEESLKPTSRFELSNFAVFEL